MKAFDTAKMWKRMEKSNKRANKRMLQVLKHFFKKDDASTLLEALLHFRNLMDGTKGLYIDTDSIRSKPKKWRKLKKANQRILWSKRTRKRSKQWLTTYINLK